MMRKIPLYISIVFLFLFIYTSVLVPIFENIITLPDIPGGLLTTTLFLIIFSVFHANYFLGWKKTLVFFVITVIVSWGYEQLGVDSGLIYGNYYYTDVLGEKIGHVPIIIPLAWFMMIYPSYIIANLIVSKSPIIHENKILKIILLSVRLFCKSILILRYNRTTCYLLIRIVMREHLTRRWS